MTACAAPATGSYNLQRMFALVLSLLFKRLLLPVFVSLFASLLILFVVPSSSAVWAAEIAQVRALSHIGQAFSAEVELAPMSAEEAQGLQVKLAQPDTYRLANIRRNPILNHVRVQLRQQNQRYFVQLQSTQAVQDSYLNIYLEFIDGKGQNVRALTVWLEADPNQTAIETPVATAKEHPDGDLAVATPVYAASLVAATSANASANASAPTTTSTLASNLPVATHALPQRAKKPPPHNLAQTHALPAAHAANCGKNLQQAQLAAQRCELNAVENVRIAVELDVLETKVDVLRRVILAEDAAPTATPISTPPSLAPLAPSEAKVISKPKKLSESKIPWRILVISAVVFVAVAVLAFLLLMLRSRWQKKLKKAKLPNPANADAQANPDGAAASEVEAQPVVVKAGLAAKLRQGWGKFLAALKAPFSKLAQLAKKIKLPRKKAKEPAETEAAA